MTDIIEALHSIAHSYSMKSKWEELYHETIEAYSLLKQNALHDAGEKIEEYAEKYEKNSDIKAPQFIDALKTSPQGLPNAFSGIGTKIGAVWSLIIMANVVTFPLLLILIKVPVIGKLVFVLFGITLVFHLDRILQSMLIYRMVLLLLLVYIFVDSWPLLL